MAAELFAVGAVNGAPEYTSKALRQLFSTFAGAAPAGRVFGGHSGVRPGVPSSIVTVSSTTWAVAAHPGFIDELAAVDHGGYLYALPDESGPITAADATNPRKDRLDVQIVEGNGTTTHDSVDIKYTAGVPASNAVVPSAPGNSFPLGVIDMPKAGGGDPTFTWTAPTAGGMVRAQATQNSSQSIGTSWEATTGWGTNNPGDNVVSWYQGQGEWKVPTGLGGIWRFTVRLRAHANDGLSHTFFTRLQVSGSTVVTSRASYIASPPKEDYLMGVLDMDVRLDEGDTFNVDAQGSAAFSTSTGVERSMLRFERVGP